VRIERDDGLARIVVADDGVGGAGTGGGSGLRGLADRVEALGGRLALDSPVGQGTTVRAEIPSP
jgi:signal transduction histidine kinase